MGDKSFREIYEDTRLFYRLPKKLFEDSNFKEMTCEAKILCTCFFLTGCAFQESMEKTGEMNTAVYLSISLSKR